MDMIEHTDNIYAAYTSDAFGGGVWGTGTSPDDAIAAYAAATGSDPMDYPVLTAKMTQRLADLIEAHGFDASRETFRVLPNGDLDIDEDPERHHTLRDLAELVQRRERDLAPGSETSILGSFVDEHRATVQEILQDDTSDGYDRTEAYAIYARAYDRLEQWEADGSEHEEADLWW